MTLFMERPMSEAADNTEDHTATGPTLGEIDQFYADMTSANGTMENTWDRSLIAARKHETAAFSNLPNAKRRLARGALFLGATSTIIMGLYGKDAAAVDRQLKDARPVIRVIDQPENPLDSHRMIMGINGLGTNNATNVMEALPYESLGLETALEYDKRGIDTTAIKNEVKEFARARGIDQIVLSGHSMGGDVALEVASLLHIDPEAPEVSDVILDCTPPNLSAVQDDKRRAGDAMLSAIEDIPKHRSSRILRGTGEMISRYDSYVHPGQGSAVTGRMIDISDFAKEVINVKNDKLSPKSGSLGLFEDQYRQIVADGAGESFERLSEVMKDKRIPRVHYLRPYDSRSDRTVKVDRSVEIFDKLSEKYSIPFLVYRLPEGTGHANPAQRPQQYSFVLDNQILPGIRQAYDIYRDYKKTGDIIEKDSEPAIDREYY